MSKTETLIIESLTRKGSFVGHGRRVFNAARRLRAALLRNGWQVTLEAFNGNGAAFRSQWDSPRCLPCYEVAIHPCRPATPSGVAARAAQPQPVH